MRVYSTSAYYYYSLSAKSASPKNRIMQGPGVYYTLYNQKFQKNTMQ